MSESVTIETITPENYNEAVYTPEQLCEFLFEHLEQYGDAKEHIMACLDYALGRKSGRRGFILAASDSVSNGPLLGVVVVCETGMTGYIPENLLVYIAVDSKARGRGVGKALMKNAVDIASGDVALHVESDNPARILYERLGFTNKYLEMRYKK